MKTGQTRLLCDVESGKTAVIEGINAGHGLAGRLAAMGLLPKATVTVVRDGRSGPVILNVKGSRVMLGRGMAQKITVR